MNHHLSTHSGTDFDKQITYEQFNQVIEAILMGKYSWACVLMLRFVGYNPLHYIPYRTYNRLIKKESLLSYQTSKDKASCKEFEPKSLIAQSNSPRYMQDLEYLEDVREKSTQVTGGTSNNWLAKNYLTMWNKKISNPNL
ncbi:HetP family heterocyst commitment protein [Acaryochloris sp. CCMEE 5410]|uniref:HetP family heterocyst commitment protein n=1 Tax=Acaryochloris sp. CCMEE 5410 TaxID=310037 RepID=UPI0002485313|nr:HetP family heterocyst commitment protein [Acaryochloris sp. CCMEE 5410]KAI9133750.1 HetP family heterocyst commitment protein [Acaryochloris sp. CCMEE 5410]